jgi:hypothetical protein
MILGESQQFASPEEALKHYGVKGMRKGHGTPKRIDRKNGRDPKRLAILYGRRRGKREPYAVQSKMADHVNEKVDAVNEKYRNEDFSNIDWNDSANWTPRAKEYHAEVLALTTEGHRVSVKDVYGELPKGKQRAELNGTSDQIVIRDVAVKHADDDPDVVAILKVIRDVKGLIIQVEPLEQEEMLQAALGEEFVKHFMS